MKKKVKVGGLKIKVSWKTSRAVKSLLNFFKSFTHKEGYTIGVYSPPSPDVLRMKKIYRIFKQEHCEFFPGNRYGINGTEPSCFVYYKGCTKIGCERCLIGEMMYGEGREEFFIRKGIFVDEDIHEYRLVQNNIVLARYDKEWMEQQETYQ